MLEMKFDRAWGYYKVLDEGNGWKIKELVVAPNSCLSLQRHHYRSETWLVKSGSGTYIHGSEDYNLSADHIQEGFILEISAGHWHQLINGTNKDLVIHELQYGTKCDEEDIERK